MSWVDHLVCWFTEYKRSLPWRESNDAYAVWVSEIMLQQTRIEAVLGYYQRFMQAFPTVEALAGAPLERVLKLWEGLGYYSRARNLHKAAQQIVERGGFPRTSAELQTLAGIGEYTAGAIAAIAFGEPALAIDGNVMRVVSRLYALEEDVLLASSRKHVKELLLQVYPKNRASDFVQGLMELGELVCIPKTPRCERCPLQTDCQALARGLQTKLPLRVPKTKQRLEHRVVCIVQKEGKVLLFQRPQEGLLPGLWEYPNVLAAEPKKARSALKETYGIDLKPLELMGKAEHVYTHIRWQMQFFRAEAGSDFAAARRPYRWATREELRQDIMLPTAFKKIDWEEWS